MNRREFLKSTAGALIVPAFGATAGLIPTLARAQESSQTLITNVRPLTAKENIMVQEVSLRVRSTK